MKRVALVTGGTRGLGEAIACALHDDGYRVAAVYHHNAATAEAFQKSTSIPVYRWDVASYAECWAGVQKVERQIGPIEILVNNAGITRDAVLHHMNQEQWQDVINTNLGSVFNMTRNIIAGMRERGFGRIINISSVNGERGQAGQVNYAAAKAGVPGLCRAVAMELAPRGIRCNAVIPGLIETPQSLDPVNSLGPEGLALAARGIPLGRVGQAREIAALIRFLTSDDASYITGQSIIADGGLTVRWPS